MATIEGDGDKADRLAATWSKLQFINWNIEPVAAALTLHYEHRRHHTPLGFHAPERQRTGNHAVVGALPDTIGVTSSIAFPFVLYLYQNNIVHPLCYYTLPRAAGVARRGSNFFWTAAGMLNTHPTTTTVTTTSLLIYLHEDVPWQVPTYSTLSCQRLSRHIHAV